MSPRLLVLLPQLPHDPASGASRTASTVADLLATDGFSVQTIATTATEGAGPVDITAWLAEQDISAACEVVCGARVLRFIRHGCVYSLINTGDAGVTAATISHAHVYDLLVDDALTRFRPDLVLTYGGSTVDVARQRRIGAAGPRVVFGLYNTRYLKRGFFDHVDAVITPSAFLTARYRDGIGLHSTPLPTPLWPADTIARRRTPACVTMVNPSIEKGLMVFAAIVQLLGTECPDIPIEIYASRDTPLFTMQAALVGGVDLSAHPRLHMCGTASRPRTVYANARVVVVPSIVEDAAPRVIAEALANGVPPIGSDRGGIPEMCTDAGFVLPLPRDLAACDLKAVSAEVVRPWVDLIAKLFRDFNLWQDESERALRAGARYLAHSVTRAYADYFYHLLKTLP